MSRTNPVRVGVVGLSMGRHHAEMYKKVPQCQLVALCDSDAARLSRVAGQLEVQRTFTDAQAMFESGQIDAVSIATPNFTHHPLTMRALKAGLHVLCEKPLALSAGQAQQMVALAKQKKLKLAVHFNHRLHPTIQQMRRFVEAGDLGDIYYARTFWHRRMGIPRGASEWFYIKEKAGGGCLIDLGVHILDIILYLCGFPKIVSVSGQTCSIFGEADLGGKTMDVEDFATGYFRTASGGVIALEVSWACHHEHPEQIYCALYGTKGGMSRKLDNYRDETTEIHRREHGGLSSAKLVRCAPYTTTVEQDFVASIVEDRVPMCGGEHGLLAMKLIDALYKSARTGREVKIDQ